MVVSIFIIASGERISIQEARIVRVRLRSHAAPPKAHGSLISATVSLMFLDSDIIIQIINAEI